MCREQEMLYVILSILRLEARNISTAVSYWLGNFVEYEQLVESNRQNASS